MGLGEGRHSPRENGVSSRGLKSQGEMKEKENYKGWVCVERKNGS